MKTSKKAQITVFIIIALIIAGGITGYFVIKNINQAPDFEERGFNEQIGIVKQALDDCLDIIYKDSLDFVASQGGYYQEPFNYYYEDDTYLPIYSFNQENTIPTKEFIEKELSLSVDNNIYFCIDGLKSKYNAINIEYDGSLTTTNILEDRVKFSTEIPITLSSKDGLSTATIESDKKEIPSDIDNMIKVADYYVSSKTLSQETICIECITELAETFDLSIEILNFQQDMISIDIFSNNVKNYPAVFSFLDVYSDESGTFAKINSDNLNNNIQEKILEQKEISQSEYNKAIDEQESKLPAPI